MPLTIVHPGACEASIAIERAREAVVSWNTDAAHGTIAVRVRTAAGASSSWLPYVTFSAHERRSLNGSDAVATIDKDILTSSDGMCAIDVRSDVPLHAVAVTTPEHCAAARPAASVGVRIPMAQPLDVPRRSQYHRAFPNERGWCSPASVAMLLAFWGIAEPLERVATAVRDDSYGGCGQWAFNVAYAGAHGLRAVVAHLSGTPALARFAIAGIPVAVSVSWSPGELPGAPVEHSEGHFVVVRGCDEEAVAVNDPAHPEIATTYPRHAFERSWLGHGGVAYLIAPPARAGEFALLAAS